MPVETRPPCSFAVPGVWKSHIASIRGRVIEGAVPMGMPIMRIILSVTAGFIMLMQQMPAHAASIVTDWLDDALPAANEVAWEPTIGSRFLTIFYTAIYDAWTAYDPVAVGVVSGITLKNQGGANNEANKREAISYAAYTVLCALAPQRRRALAERMQSLGYEPAANTLPASVGRRAAYGVLSWRRTRRIERSQQLCRHNWIFTGEIRRA